MVLCQKGMKGKTGSDDSSFARLFSRRKRKITFIRDHGVRKVLPMVFIAGTFSVALVVDIYPIVLMMMMTGRASCAEAAQTFWQAASILATTLPI